MLQITGEPDMPSAGEKTTRHAIIHWVVPLALAAVAALLGIQTSSLASYLVAPLSVSPAPVYTPSAVHAPGPDFEAVVPVSRRLASGESMGHLLEELGLPPGDRHVVLALLGDHAEIRRLRPGLRVTARYGGGPGPRELEFELRRKGRLRLVPSKGGWSGELQPFETSRTLEHAAGEISSSLVSSMTRVGAPIGVAYGAARVLRWDLDFNRDLRRGDRFEILYEAVSVDGRFDHVGDIVAIRFWNRGRLFEAYRYGEDAYFDGDGRPLEKMFLRSPLPFTRVTSRFSHRRFHPVLKRYRPHYGVDYGAPTGTPVSVTAHGTVTHAAYGRGEGRMVKVRHRNGYLSAYLHLSRFADGIRPGVRVRQGQTIGYVGSTGLSTGPHLDYRIQHRGRWIDPLSIDPVPAEPIPDDELAVFEAWRDALRSQLEHGVAEFGDRRQIADLRAEDPVAATASLR